MNQLILLMRGHFESYSFHTIYTNYISNGQGKFYSFFFYTTDKKMQIKGKLEKKIPHDMTPLNEHEFALRDVFMTSVA